MAINGPSFEAIPKNLKLYITSFMTTAARGRLSQTNKAFNTLINQNTTYQYLIRCHHPHLQNDSRYSKNAYKLYKEETQAQRILLKLFQEFPIKGFLSPARINLLDSVSAETLQAVQSGAMEILRRSPHYPQELIELAIAYGHMQGWD